MKTIFRRNFIKTSVIGGISATFFSPLNIYALPGNISRDTSSVALTTGDDRVDISFRALEPFSRQVKNAIGNRRVIIGENIKDHTRKYKLHDKIEQQLIWMKPAG